jgi:hypothetical protein
VHLNARSHFKSFCFYAISSCSMYIKAKAITKPGNIIPIMGTRIEGR